MLRHHVGKQPRIPRLFSAWGYGEDYGLIDSSRCVLFGSREYNFFFLTNIKRRKYAPIYVHLRASAFDIVLRHHDGLYSRKKRQRSKNKIVAKDFQSPERRRNLHSQ